MLLSLLLLCFAVNDDEGDRDNDYDDVGAAVVLIPVSLKKNITSCLCFPEFDNICHFQIF